MNRNAMCAAVLAAMLTGAAPAAAGWFDKEGKHGKLDKAAVESLIKDWPKTSKAAAEKSIEKYGLPKEATGGMLAWQDVGDFKKVAVFREEVQHNFPQEHVDVLLQTVAYQVPADKADELLQFDGSLQIDRTKGTLGSKCDREEANYLALNIANEIVTGKRQVADARNFLSQTISEMMAGKTSQYTQKLLFTASSNAGFKDQPVSGRQGGMQEGGRTSPGGQESIPSQQSPSGTQQQQQQQPQGQQSPTYR